MLYSVKNVVEGFEEIDYNDGVRNLFLYTDGEYGGSPNGIHNSTWKQNFQCPKIQQGIL